MSAKKALEHLRKTVFEARHEWEGSCSVRFGKRHAVVIGVPAVIADNLAGRLNAVVTETRVELSKLMSENTKQTNLFEKDEECNTKS